MNPIPVLLRDPRWRFGAAGLLALGLVLLFTGSRGCRRQQEDLGPLYVVTEGPLTISVVGAGTVQNRRNATVRSEVEGRNTIIWLIDEGRSVTNGELLVELDSSTFTDKRTDQQILVANAEAALTQAAEKLAIASNEQQAAVAEAQLKLELAHLSQSKYLAGEYPQLLQEAQSKIALAGEEAGRAAEFLNWSRKLAAETYLTRMELMSDELALRQKQIAEEAAITAINVLTNYTALEQRATLASDLRQAELALDRITRQTRADLIEAESGQRAKQLEYDRQTSRLAKLEEQLLRCRILAPTNGVVIYASTVQSSRRQWGNEPLQAGAQVVERQELINIPTDGGMSVELSVPEFSLAKLSVGQPARIRVDALPGQTFSGRLSKIGMLPDGRNAWLNPDLKLYNCEIELDRIEGLRAGMSCEVELLVEEYRAATFVPVQCVLRVGAAPTVYVAVNGRATPRVVDVGLDNNRMIRVLGGLRPGEKVLLSPPLDAAGRGGKEPEAPPAPSVPPAPPSAEGEPAAVAAPVASPHTPAGPRPPGANGERPRRGPRAGSSGSPAP